jgi:ATP/maltotriose-dependent transcriptional regulator MalT/two-component SAPR family response regulator
MADFPVIRTKTLIPRRRSEILSRPRLLEILNNVLDLKLLILAAPAGYGKTSLLVDFSHHTQAPVCWYALDSLDSDPKRFIAHFIAAVKGKFPAFGQMSQAALADLSQDKLNLDPIISTIVNDAFENITEHFIFVLDDYHLVRESKPIEIFINRIIQECAENCHFIIASRTLLTLPDLSLLVARSQVDGLSFEELAFLPEEIKQLMAVNYHQTITDQKAEEMINRTEGWIAGLLLTAQLTPKGGTERTRVEKVSGVGIYEYLTQQVFDRQTAAMQSFLLRTSLLEEFDASLCEKIVGKALGLEGQNWDEVIDRIQRENLFVLQVGDETVFLRYHHLFRDFLQNRMRVERPEETHRIETELANYYESIQEWERAVAIYFRTGKPEQQVEIIRRAAPSMILSGRLVTLSDWLDLLPGDLADGRPELKSIRGSIAMLRGDYKTSLGLLNDAIHDLRKSGANEELASALIRRSAINRHMGHYDFALKDAQEASELTRPPFGSPHKYAEALRAEGLVHYQNGELNDAQWKLRESYRRYQDLGMESDAAKVLMDLGIVYNARGDFDQVEKCLNDSMEYWQTEQNPLWQANVLNNIGILKHQTSQYEQAVITLEKALSYARIAVNPRVEGYILTGLGDIYRDVHALQEAKLAYQQAAAILEKTNDLSLEIYLTLATAVLDRLAGDYSASQRQITTAIEKVEKSGSKYERNLCLLEQYALDMRTGKLNNIDQSFLQLEEYFIAAGFHLEAYKASVYRAVAKIQSGTQNLTDEILEIFRPVTDRSKKQTIIHIAMEYRTLFNELAEKNDAPVGVIGLIKEIKNFENTLPAIHRVVRRYSSAIDFGNPKLTIRAFGRSQIKISGKNITSGDMKTQTARDLFFFILAHPEGVTKEEIGEAFWPDADEDTIKLRFKNSIYRLRRAIGTGTITYVDNYYRFNRALDYDYDVDTFLAELELARKSQDSTEMTDHYRAALSSYHGKFLPKIDQEWIISEREKHHLAFMAASLELGNLYMRAGKYTQALAVAHRALEEDNYNEVFHRSAMVAYSALDDRPAVVRQFENCKRILRKELNIDPSPQTITLYNSLVQ